MYKNKKSYLTSEADSSLGSALPTGGWERGKNYFLYVYPAKNAFGEFWIIMFLKSYGGITITKFGLQPRNILK